MNWDEIAKKHQDTLRFIAFIQRTGCLICSAKPKRWEEFEFHLKSTHGIDKELIPLFVKKYKELMV